VSEWIDDSGYPTEDALTRIERWEGTPIELIEFVGNLWRYDTANLNYVNGWSHNPDTPAYQWQLATMGWSGNESLIESLSKTYFWMRFWYSHIVGGGYTFYLPNLDAHRVGFWGDLRYYPQELLSGKSPDVSDS